jgi:hypothetical protein
MDVLRLDRRGDWLDLVSRAWRHDFHHLPFFHALAEGAGEGGAHLFVHRDGDDFVALPLLLRPVETLPCHAETGRGWSHGTSVYGYAGPLVSRPDLPEAVLAAFRAALTLALVRRQVTSVFSRLHPLLNQRPVLDGLGELAEHGQTVSVDLTLPVDVQRTHFRSSHKRHLNKLARAGATWTYDPAGEHLEAFAACYDQSMRRVGASASYDFGIEHFRAFFDTDDVEAFLGVVRIEDDVAAVGLFTRCGPIVQAHLNGTADRFLSLSPAKLMYDGTRLWSTEHGATFLHIGGGLGGGEDPLFNFKAGFSRQRHDFVLWRWILQDAKVAELTDEKRTFREDLGLSGDTGGFFPPFFCGDCPCNGG